MHLGNARKFGLYRREDDRTMGSGWELGQDGIKLESWNKGMWEWLFDLLLARPYVFEGYEAQIDGENLVLVRSTHIPKHYERGSEDEGEKLNKLRWETPRT